MNVAELRKELSAGRTRPAYLVVGGEPLLRDDALRLLREAVLTPGTEDFNFDRLEGARARPAAILDSVGTLPVSASWCGMTTKFAFIFRSSFHTSAGVWPLRQFHHRGK